MNRLTFRLILAQSLDALTFVIFYALVGPSIHQERNPIILALMALGGIQMVGFVKVAVSLAVSYRATHPRKPITRRWYQPMQTILISAATASGIAGAGFNLAAILLH